MSGTSQAHSIPLGVPAPHIHAAGAHLRSVDGDLDPQSLLKASLTFSPACLRLLTVWSLRPSRSICSSSLALPRFSLAAPLTSSFLFFNLSYQPIIGLLSRVLSP